MRTIRIEVSGGKEIVVIGQKRSEWTTIEISDTNRILAAWADMEPVHLQRLALALINRLNERGYTTLLRAIDERLRELEVENV